MTAISSPLKEYGQVGSTIIHYLGVAQLVECLVWNREAEGSSPSAVTNLRCSSEVVLSGYSVPVVTRFMEFESPPHPKQRNNGSVAQLGERRTCNADVEGSSPSCIHQIDGDGR